MLSAENNASERVQQWFNDLVENSGQKKGQIAEILNVSNSAVSKISSGSQSLKADQMIVLAESLNYPLPAKQARAKPMEIPALGSFPRELFDRAYAQVAGLEALKPPAERMDTYAMLDTVFYVLERMLQQPIE